MHQAPADLPVIFCLAAKKCSLHVAPLVSRLGYLDGLQQAQTCVSKQSTNIYRAIPACKSAETTRAVQMHTGLAIPQINMGLLKDRLQGMNNYDTYPLASCLTSVFAAGGVILSPADLSDHYDVLLDSLAQYNVCDEEGLAVFLGTIQDLVAETKGPAAAEAAGDRMRQLMGLCARNFVEGWRGAGMVLSGAVCACRGPAYAPQDMQCVWNAVAAVQAQCEVSGRHIEVQELLEINQAMQVIGSNMLPLLTAVA
jgi:hypothetical protein